MRSRRSLGRVGLRGEHLARGVIHHGPGLPRSGISAIREEHDIIRMQYPADDHTLHVISRSGPSRRYARRRECPEIVRRIPGSHNTAVMYRPANSDVHIDTGWASCPREAMPIRTPRPAPRTVSTQPRNRMPDGRRGAGIVSMRASGVAPVMTVRLAATTGIIPFGP